MVHRVNDHTLHIGFNHPFGDKKKSGTKGRAVAEPVTSSDSMGVELPHGSTKFQNHLRTETGLLTGGGQTQRSIGKVYALVASALRQGEIWGQSEERRV